MNHVRTPKEIDAYIDKVYDLLAEGEQVSKVRQFDNTCTK